MSDETKTDEQTELGGTEAERPPQAGIRFSLSEAKARLKSMRVLGALQDDEGPLSRLKLVLSLGLTTDEAEQLPEVGPAVVELVKLGTTLPDKAKNSFRVALGREFAGAKYTLKTKAKANSKVGRRVNFNGTVKGTPVVSVVKGEPTLQLQLEAVVRNDDVEKLTAFLEDHPLMTVEPPQQELDLGVE